jgi:hypothetical protein
MLTPERPPIYCQVWQRSHTYSRTIAAFSTGDGQNRSPPERSHRSRRPRQILQHSLGACAVDIGSQPCGDSCISLERQCKKETGCACSAAGGS